MFSALLERVAASPLAATHLDETRASPSNSIISTITVDVASDPQSSSSSTPPTSIGDEASISSTSLKLETIVTAVAPPPEAAPTEVVAESSGRSRRARASVGTYNVKVLSGTAIHAPRKYLKNPDGTPVAPKPRRRTISGDTLVEADQLIQAADEAFNPDWSVKKLPRSKSQIGLAEDAKKTPVKKVVNRRKSMLSTSDKVVKKFSVLGKRSRQTLDEGLSNLAAKVDLPKVPRELKRLQDTDEFAKRETIKVIHEIWSNGKLVVEERPSKKKKVAEAPAVKQPVPKVEEPVPPEPKIVGKREKVWLTKGLYAGQLAPAKVPPKVYKSPYSSNNDGSLPEEKPRKILPMPLFHGQRLMEIGRDFKLPFDVCSPLPPGQPKPDQWSKTHSNQFVGNAKDFWKKPEKYDAFSSQCVCTKEHGCDERCQNRLMFYECDDNNCRVGRNYCGNRAFAELSERRKAGGKYRIGVEVLKTADRGYGVRSNRCFEPNQIIVEYTGEIITEEECDRRMNEVYKNNECYYLMSFDQNMILDGTKGSIARFINHSCKPNCKMVKWLVAGKPRMALFAGDNPIMTGDELTYDYNFDPFSAKNIQECRCGSDNCRGVLGPKPKDPKPVKEAIKDVLKAGVKAGKRKLKEFLGADGEDAGNPRSPKKRAIKAPKGLKRSASSASMMAVKGAVKAVRRTASTQILKSRQSASRPQTPVTKKTAKANPLKTYGKAKGSSRNSSLTMVATEDVIQLGTPEKMSSVGKRSVKKSVSRGAYVADQTTPSGKTGKSIRVVSTSDQAEDGAEDDDEK
ncbi:hypothetical protein HYFRA_00011821 [Hymenoscyphus fraxineus]|uniref:Histone-lysine N-methyltransferase ASH1L n=1 Tax=Hymenoscyphus fraxineus TaxID=746836 RepID=A0A9N9PXH1_9HELO|nr:hypothetical protein HYFRA_00011821 [Hymenoscyphus fraxineus]